VPAWQPKPSRRRRRELSEKLERKRFAEGVARAEFGRSYWSGELEAELQAALKRRPKRAS
jgi:hypothetical protein